MPKTVFVTFFIFVEIFFDKKSIIGGCLKMKLIAYGATFYILGWWCNLIIV